MSLTTCLFRSFISHRYMDYFSLLFECLFPTLLLLRLLFYRNSSDSLEIDQWMITKKKNRLFLLTVFQSKLEVMVVLNFTG
jgi:hypothetical protein